MLFFRLYCLREIDMDNKDEVLLTSLLLVSKYLRNTNRVPNAIEMCKEVLFLLEHKTLGNIDQMCVKSFENVQSPNKARHKISLHFSTSCRDESGTKHNLYTGTIIQKST